MKSYWARMTPEERSAEMTRRIRMGQRKRRREQASTESPFPPEIRDAPKITASRRNLKGLITDLEAITSELKAMFGD
jgi:hypothetical protein